MLRAHGEPIQGLIDNAAQHCSVHVQEELPQFDASALQATLEQNMAELDDSQGDPAFDNAGEEEDHDFDTDGNMDANGQGGSDVEYAEEEEEEEEEDRQGGARPAVFKGISRVEKWVADLSSVVFSKAENTAILAAALADAGVSPGHETFRFMAEQKLENSYIQELKVLDDMKPFGDRMLALRYVKKLLSAAGAVPFRNFETPSDHAPTSQPQVRLLH